MLRLYNTLTKKIEDFHPQNPPVVTYYSCGPTVYDYAHIGHGRTYVFADILHRALEYNGYRVKRVMNITDVGHLTSDSDTGEDKIEKKATSEKKSVHDIAKYYTDDFFHMMDNLNIKRPEIVCKATDWIDEMIKLVQILEKKGYTYKISDGVYFDTSKFSTYGRLAGQTFQKLQKSLKAGARVEVVEGKKHPTDFALWKFSPKEQKRQMEWNSPWGVGFPGWHIECSVMSMQLGETIDIHTGGIEHIPIHHTNEIAQSEAATGKTFVRYWLHADHLLVEGEKMSKSSGNFYRVNDLQRKGIKPLSLRYLFLTAHYRKQLNFTWKAIQAAQKALTGLKEQIADIKRSSIGKKRMSLSAEKMEKIDNARSKFAQAIDNDLNTSQALACLWAVVKSNIPPTDKYDLIVLFDEVLGLGLAKSAVSQKPLDIPFEVKKLLDQREKFRQEKNWKEADKLRGEVESIGYAVEDTPAGPRVKKRS